jgi:hypothetical protein
MAHKFGVIGLPFNMWRLIVQGHVHSAEEMESVKKAQAIIAQQMMTQSLHANCGSPSFSTRSSHNYQDHFEMVVTCDCGEELTVIDGVKKEALAPVSKTGAYIPTKHHA